jgi:hypothetical protein
LKTTPKRGGSWLKERSNRDVVLVKGKRVNNTTGTSVVMRHLRGDVTVLLSVEHGLMNRKDVNRRYP